MAHHKPVIDQRAAEQMNLNVLKRIDPQIEEVGAVGGRGMRLAPPTSRAWGQGQGCGLPVPAPARRCSPALQLLATAGHVALYDFDIPTKRWVRCAAWLALPDAAYLSSALPCVAMPSSAHMRAISRPY